ncbi:E3 ubiquitin-protein ligase TRIM39-like isoform X1, partial [Clarias magur]
MASSSSVLCEDQLQCSICLEVFTDPVSTPCGHNYCMTCLKLYWDSSLHCQCPICKTYFAKRPELCVNTFISGLAAVFKESVQVKSRGATDQLPSMTKKVLCDSCTEEKLEAVKSCLHCGLSLCNTHLIPHKTTAKLMKHKLMEPVENLEDYICQKHERPLELFCRDDQMCVCQFCIEADHKTHNTVPIEEASAEKKIQLGKTRAEIQQMIQEQLKKTEEIKHSVALMKKNIEKEKTDVVEIFSYLMCCIERSQAKLLKMMEEKQKAAERQAEEFIKDLEQEVTELKRRNTELEQLSHTEDHLHLLQIYPSLCSPPHTQDWTDVTINCYLSVETMRRALSQIHQRVSDEMEMLEAFKLKRIQQCAVDVSLDPDTAHPKLKLSHDGKQVKYGDKRQNLPDNPERFDQCYYVLGKDGFSSKRFYFEVQVKEKTAWNLGVASGSSNRKGNITACPKNGYWCISLRNATDHLACESSPVCLPLPYFPQKVGVFVDYEEGLISFYDVNAMSHIYSFTGQTFTEKLHPLFNPCFIDGVDVTLDPKTANSYLILSDDGKQVLDGDKRQNLPDNPERFDFCVCVLGKEGFSSGRFYYEVQVRGKTKWDLGVARESINRKGKIAAKPKNGVWCVWLRNGTEFEALDSPPVLLSLKQAPQKVGVFVDYEEGLISFYDVEAKSHIYSFT